MRSYLSDSLPILSARWRFKTWVTKYPLHICLKNFWTVIAHSVKAKNRIDMILNPSMGAWLFVLLAKAFLTFLNIPPDWLSFLLCSPPPPVNLIGSSHIGTNWVARMSLYVLMPGLNIIQNLPLLGAQRGLKTSEFSLCVIEYQGYQLSVWPYYHMASKVANMVISENSYKNAAIWWRNRVDSTVLHEMRANMVRWQIFLCIFSDFPLYLPKMMATPH